MLAPSRRTTKVTSSSRSSAALLLSLLLLLDVLEVATGCAEITYSSAEACYEATKNDPDCGCGPGGEDDVDALIDGAVNDINNEANDAIDCAQADIDNAMNDANNAVNDVNAQIDNAFNDAFSFGWRQRRKARKLCSDSSSGGSSGGGGDWWASDVCEGEELQEATAGCVDAAACRDAAIKMGLELGTATASFSDFWTTQGCHYYPADHPTIPNTAFFGIILSCDELRAPPGDGGVIRISCLPDSQVALPTSSPATNQTGMENTGNNIFNTNGASANAAVGPGTLPNSSASIIPSANNSWPVPSMPPLRGNNTDFFDPSSSTPPLPATGTPVSSSLSPVINSGPTVPPVPGTSVPVGTPPPAAATAQATPPPAATASATTNPAATAPPAGPNSNVAGSATTAPNSNVVQVDTAFSMFSTQPEFNSAGALKKPDTKALLEQAFATFVADVVTSMQQRQVRRQRRQLRQALGSSLKESPPTTNTVWVSYRRSRRRLQQASLQAGSTRISDIRDDPGCAAAMTKARPEGGTCFLLYGQYNLLIPGGGQKDSQNQDRIRKQYQQATSDAIQSGKLEESIKLKDPNAPFVVSGPVPLEGQPPVATTNSKDDHGPEWWLYLVLVALGLNVLLWCGAGGILYLLWKKLAGPPPKQDPSTSSGFLDKTAESTAADKRSIEEGSLLITSPNNNRRASNNNCGSKKQGFPSVAPGGPPDDFDDEFSESSDGRG